MESGCIREICGRGRGWFHFLVDRKKDVIISGGENIYPVQIEDFLRTHEAVHDVAVIGLPDHRLGEISAAIIALKQESPAMRKILILSAKSCQV